MNPTPVQPTLQEPVAIKTTQKTEPMGEKNEYEVVILINKSSSKIHKPKSYDKAVHDPIHRYQWQEAVKEEPPNI